MSRLAFGSRPWTKGRKTSSMISVSVGEVNHSSESMSRGAVHAAGLAAVSVLYRIRSIVLVSMTSE